MRSFIILNQIFNALCICWFTDNEVQFKWNRTIKNDRFIDILRQVAVLSANSKIADWLSSFKKIERRTKLNNKKNNKMCREEHYFWDEKTSVSEDAIGSKRGRHPQLTHYVSFRKEIVWRIAVHRAASHWKHWKIQMHLTVGVPGKINWIFNWSYPGPSLLVKLSCWVVVRAWSGAARSPPSYITIRG